MCSKSINRQRISNGSRDFFGERVKKAPATQKLPDAVKAGGGNFDSPTLREHWASASRSVLPFSAKEKAEASSSLPPVGPLNCRPAGSLFLVFRTHRHGGFLGFLGVDEALALEHLLADFFGEVLVVEEELLGVL